MAKRLVTLCLSLDNPDAEVEVWEGEPLWNPLVNVFVPGEGSARISKFLAELDNTIVKTLGIKLKPGQCRPIEIRQLPLVRPKRVKT